MPMISIYLLLDSYPDPHLKILKSIKWDEIENYLILFIEHCLSVIYVTSYNLIAFSHFARYLADVGKMWGKSLVVPRKSITFVPRFPHHQKKKYESYVHYQEVSKAL